jgi:type II secretory pathway component GspD/PulD (secretin)
MRNLKNAGAFVTTTLFFVALLSVYNGQALPAAGAVGDAATQPSDIFSSSAPPATQPAEAVAPPKITLSDSGTFSIQINNDVPLVEVLRMIGSQAQISIIPSKEVRGTVPAMDLYSVTVHEALDAILQSNGFAWEQKGNIIYVYSQDEMDKRSKRNLVTEVYRLYYINAADALTLLKPVLSVDGLTSVTPADSSSGGGGGGASSGSSSSSSSGSGSGGSSSSGGGGGSAGASGGSGLSGGNSYANIDMIVITDHPENQERIRQLIKEVDRRPQQILVEATILEVELTENNSLGVDFTILGGVNLNSSSSGSSGSIPGAISSISHIPSAIGVSQQNGNFQFGVIGSDIAVFLNALETVANTTVLSNPKVLTLDKQEGKVHIGETIYFEGTNTATATTNTVTVNSLDTGVTLDFKPYIGDDGYIRMEIDPSDSTPVGQATLANGLPPNVNANEVTANIMVKDGHTVMIGGLFSDNSSSNKSQVPFLGDLPLAGALFKQQADNTDRKEIIFLLTPHIVKDDAAFSELSEAEQRDAEKLRVGVRMGMMPWGRERLAETCYECAENEMKKPNPNLDIVRWHLDCATNLNPTFLEAIHMKEKLTGEVLTTSDNSSIRSFIRRQMIADIGHTPTPEEDRPDRIVKIIALPPTTRPAAATQPTGAGG